MNYLIVLEYCGTNYCGWQIQNKKGGKEKDNTIESEIKKAIKIITKFDVKLFTSGRTDAGVHALNQVANFKLPFYYDINRLKIALNGVLPNDISVKNIEIVHESFHATYDVLSKTYLYKINCGFLSPLLTDRSWFIKEFPNLNLMNESAAFFLGKNNFFYFAKKEKEKKYKNYHRVITRIDIRPKNYGFDIFIEGKGFLRHMVRRIVGALILCGTGKMNVGSLNSMLKKEADNEHNNSEKHIVCAPPCGLFLYSVKYGHKIYC